VIYEVPKDADWKDEANWPLANPNIDVSVDRKSLRTACLKAQNVPAFENAFKRLHLNMRTEQAMRFVPMDAWDACPNDVTLESLEGRVCYMGVDLASTEDLASVALVFPLEEGRLAVICHSFCPEDRAVRRAKQRVPYDVWIQKELLIATSGNVIDYHVIRQAIVDLGKKYQVKEIGYDPHGAAQIAQDLQDNDGFELANVTQSFANLSAPTKELMRRVKSKKLVHFNNPIMRWAATNAAVHFDGKLPANAAQVDDYLDKVPIMLSKRKSADKIDPLAATVLAVARMMQHPEDGSSSVYDQRTKDGKEEVLITL
jgi:phage terminase large subunit-like protein